MYSLNNYVQIKSKVYLIVFLELLASIKYIYAFGGICALEILMEIVLIWVFHVTFLSTSYVLNMLSFCISSTSWCCFIVLLFCCTFHVPIFCGISIVLPVFQCSASILVFHLCLMFRSSVFQCSWFYCMPLLTKLWH